MVNSQENVFEDECIETTIKNNYLILPNILRSNASYATGMFHGALRRFIELRSASSKTKKAPRRTPLFRRLVLNFNLFTLWLTDVS